MEKKNYTLGHILDGINEGGKSMLKIKKDRMLKDGLYRGKINGAVFEIVGYDEEKEVCKVKIDGKITTKGKGFMEHLLIEKIEGGV